MKPAEIPFCQVTGCSSALLPWFVLGVEQALLFAATCWPSHQLLKAVAASVPLL